MCEVQHLPNTVTVALTDTGGCTPLNAVHVYILT